MIALINLNLYSWRETKFAINTAKMVISTYTDDVLYTAIYFDKTSFLVNVFQSSNIARPRSGKPDGEESEEEHKRQETVIRENIQPPIQSVHYSQASPLR